MNKNKDDKRPLRPETNDNLQSDTKPASEDKAAQIANNGRLQIEVDQLKEELRGTKDELVPRLQARIAELLAEKAQLDATRANVVLGLQLIETRFRELIARKELTESDVEFGEYLIRGEGERYKRFRAKSEGDARIRGALETFGRLDAGKLAYVVRDRLGLESGPTKDHPDVKDWKEASEVAEELYKEKNQ